MNGQELCRAFYTEAVAPLLGDIPHSAGLLGTGSEVLGFDDDTSTDHAFGPRVFVFVDKDTDAAALEARLDPALPDTFGGMTTDRRHVPGEGDVYHRIEVHTLAEWATGYLGFDATRAPTVTDWINTPTQLLAGATSGAIYHDGLDQLAPMQTRLRWYPDDVWRYVLATQWRRISQEEHFVGRTAMVGDELGSRLLAGRLVRDMIRMAFLIERVHAPYIKWLGTAFQILAIANELAPALDAALAAATYPDREAALANGYEQMMRATNALVLAAELDPTVRPFYTRGFLVTMGDRFSEALLTAITDPEVRALPRNLGAIDQHVDSTDVLSGPRPAIR
jgi:hypothetical protein